jgi:hypothetical protein
MITALKFENAKASSTPQSSHDFADFIEATKIDTPLKKSARLAKAVSLETGNKDEYDEIKKRIPAWCVGLTLKGTRKSDNVVPEGVVIVDFDGFKTTLEAMRLKERLKGCPFVLMSALSLGCFGVFAVIRVEPETQTQAARIEALWNELSIFTGMPLKDLSGAHIDTSCKDAARLRIESFDPEPYVNLEASVWMPFERLALTAYEESQFRAIGQCFGGLEDDAEHCNARNAYTLCALSMSAQGQVYGRLFGSHFYPFKAQPVVIGKSGAGKSSALRVLRRAAEALGVREMRLASDAALEDTIARSAARTDDNGETWERLSMPVPLLEIIDEAGDNKASTRKRDYSAQGDAIRRRLFDEEINLSSVLSRKLPTFSLRTAYTGLQLSTPAKWAESVNALDAEAGNARRVYEFWSKSAVDDVESTSAFALGTAFLDGLEAAASGDAETLITTLRALNTRADMAGLEDHINIDSRASEWCKRMGLPLIDKMTRESERLEAVTTAATALASFSTAAAYARKGMSIDDDDVLVAWALFYGVLETRRRLANVSCGAVQTQESRITEEILRTVQTSKSPRFDTLMKKYKSAGPQQQRIFEWLLASGRLIKYRDESGKQTRTLVRLATDEELAGADTPDFSQEQANSHKVDRGGIDLNDYGEDRQRREYADCDDETKLKRLEEYREQHNLDNPLVMHNIDNSLRSLSGKLHAAGMDDEVARLWFFDLAHSLGHTKESDKRRVWRAINK